MKSTLQFWLLGSLLVAASPQALAQHVIATIPVDYRPASVAVNSLIS